MIIKLELFLAEGRHNDPLDTVVLELCVSEAREFLLKLKEIAKEMKV
jgi:hypothetical protein